ncbi:DUF4249 family protein [Algoriphagus sp.]|uniref:DUF4249 family protein n=1 Tax=Algoriphagus sp. TaxID=1872435 RepID=UPI0025D752F9|nr:DUF4249 family protein [Algoriphagus sp.]
MKKIWFIVFCFCLFSCQEEVNLPLATIDGIVPVIEATWTDIPFYNEVKITLAENYFDSSDQTVVSNALVRILIEGTTINIPFYFNDDTQSYKPFRETSTAVVGESYELQVFWEGNVYTSKGVMLAPPIVDSLTYAYQEERLFRDEGYYIKVYGEIPFKENNYYRIKVIENDTLKNDRDDYLLFDDTFGLQFFEEGLELNYPFEAGDKVRMELFRMNKSSYDYFSQLVGLLFNDGGLFSPPPQNPDTNIIVEEGEGKVLGYFMVSPVLTETVFIRKENN